MRTVFTFACHRSSSWLVARNPDKLLRVYIDAGAPLVTSQKKTKADSQIGITLSQESIDLLRATASKFGVSQGNVMRGAVSHYLNNGDTTTTTVALSLPDWVVGLIPTERMESALTKLAEKIRAQNT